MKKSFIILLITMFSLPVHAQSLKVGYVNMKVLLTQAPQVEEINKKLQDRFGDPKKELDEMADSIQQLEKEIKRNELMMTESKLKKSKQNLLEKIKQHPDYEKAVMILCHNGVVRNTTRDGKDVTGLKVSVDHEKLRSIIDVFKKKRGIIEILVELNEDKGTWL